MLTQLGIILIHQNGLKWCTTLLTRYCLIRHLGTPTNQDDPESVHTYALLRVTIELSEKKYTTSWGTCSTFTYIKLSNAMEMEIGKSLVFLRFVVAMTEAA